MTEEEAEEYFLEVNRLLRERGLSWLAAEIASETAQGRTSPKMLSVVEYGDAKNPDEPALRQRKRKAEFTHVRSLTPKEKLEVSLNSLRAIVVASGEILPEVINTLGTPVGVTISFFSETDSQTTVLSENDSRRFLSAALELNGRLAELRKEANLGS